MCTTECDYYGKRMNRPATGAPLARDETPMWPGTG